MVYATDLSSYFLPWGRMIVAWSRWTVSCGRLVPTTINNHFGSVVGFLEALATCIYITLRRRTSNILEAGRNV